MDAAHVICLADQNRRFELYEALLARNRPDEAKRERDVLLRTAEFLSWRRSEALRRAGDDAFAAGRMLEAADLWDQAFLDNNSKETRFVEPWANVSMPALVRKTRALGLIRAGKVADGVTQAQTALAMSPGDVDALIELVTALEKAGKNSEADALFVRHARGVYAKLCDEYPTAGTLHNLYAWAAAKCGRDLDAALAHAKRAVELQPDNANNIDTLAEVHFQRGELPDAVAAMQRCVELEPNDARHKERLARFKAAKAAPSTRAATRPGRQR
jgi:tetratricopeptide (TPR) repeat protein